MSGETRINEKGDIFDEVIDLEHSFYENGKRDGLIAGKQKGSLTGASLGYQAGFSLGEEIAYMKAFVGIIRRSKHESTNHEKTKVLLDDLDRQIDQAVQAVHLTWQEGSRREEGRQNESSRLVFQDSSGEVGKENGKDDGEAIQELLEWAHSLESKEHQEQFQQLSDRIGQARSLLARLCVRLKLSRKHQSQDTNVLSF